jgi:nucleotide-binding universal stress UspA family protein
MTGDVGTFVGEQRKRWQQSLETALAEVGERVPVTGELLEGPVAPALTDLDPDTVDLLVCGSRGYGPVRRVLLGGISARVVRNSRVPVVVVPRG